MFEEPDVVGLAARAWLAIAMAMPAEIRNAERMRSLPEIVPQPIANGTAAKIVPESRPPNMGHFRD
jgi:hypothetical protein